MANISVTYTFANSTTADATEVNTNFQDIIDGTSDASKDMSISALTVAGTLTANGNVNIGNATSDDLTITARVASDIDPKTASANDLGDATQLWQAAYVDNFLASINAVGDPSYSFHADTDTGMYSAGANTLNFGTGGTLALSIDSSQVVTLSTALDLAGSEIRTLSLDTVAKTADYTVTDTDGVSVIYMTTSTTDRTVTLPTAADNAGRVITAKKVDSASGRLFFDGEGSETVDGETGDTATCPLQYDFATVQCDGSNWHIIARRAISNWISYTPGHNWGANATATGYYRRNGDSIDLDLHIAVTGTPVASTNLEIDLPSGFTINSSFLTSVDSFKGPLFGVVQVRDNSAGSYMGSVRYEDSNTVRVDYVKDNGTFVRMETLDHDSPVTQVSGDAVHVRCFSIPISEWAD